MAFQYIKPTAAFRNKHVNQTYLTMPTSAAVSQFQAELRVNSTRINDRLAHTVNKYGVIGEPLSSHRYNAGSFHPLLPATLLPAQKRLPVPVDSLLLRNRPVQDNYSSNISSSGNQMPTQKLEILSPQPIRYFRHALISWEKLLSDLDQQSSGASDERGGPTNSAIISTRRQRHSDTYPSPAGPCGNGPTDSQTGSSYTENKINRYRALLETCLAPTDTRQGLFCGPVVHGSDGTRLQNHPRRLEANQTRNWKKTSRSTLYAILNH